MGMNNESDPMANLRDRLSLRSEEWLRVALTHSSYSNEHPEEKVGHNERLEFLGDSVLSLCVSHLLMERAPNATEGRLSQLRSALVDEPSLAEAARRLGVGDALRLGRGEEQSGGRQKPSLLADAYEAVIAAIYLTEGFSRALAFVSEQLQDALELLLREGRRKDHKTQLQELLQRRFGEPPVYSVIDAQGPDHAKTFYVALAVQGEILSQGEGRSKKEAEQRAAEAALARMETKPEGSPSSDPG